MKKLTFLLIMNLLEFLFPDNQNNHLVLDLSKFLSSLRDMLDIP